MLPLGQFTEIYGELDSVGNVLRGLGKPGGILRSEGTEKAYSYVPFHRFDLSFMAASCETAGICASLEFLRRAFH